MSEHVLDEMTLILCECLRCSDCGVMLRLDERTYSHPANDCKFSGVEIRVREIHVSSHDFVHPRKVKERDDPGGWRI